MDRRRTCWRYAKIVGAEGEDLEIGFTLRPGATVDDAHKVAKSMNDWIVDTVLY